MPAIVSKAAFLRSPSGQESWRVSSLVRIMGPMKLNSSPTSD